MYPRRIGECKWGTFPPSLESRTLAHVLRNAGYRTAIAGKWQLTLLKSELDHPNRLGFDEYSLFGWHEGPRYHEPLIWQNGKQRGDTEGTFGPDLYVDFLVDFMARNKQQPFFVMYSMALSHDVSDDLMTPVPYAPGLDRYMSFAEMMASMDKQIGRLLDSIQRLGIADETVILFTADNGTPIRSIISATKSTDPNAKGRKKWTYIRDNNESKYQGRIVPGGKGTLRDSGTNVPLIVHVPGNNSRGETVNDLVDFSDFLPTLAECAAADLPGSKIDGVSFAGRILGKEAEKRKWAYSEKADRFWIRTAEWKLYNDGAFFHVATDRDENRNLADADLSSDARAAHQMLQTAINDYQDSLDVRE